MSRVPFCFYPRHPCGWRHKDGQESNWAYWFLSTPPVWVATVVDWLTGWYKAFLSTPPVWVATGRWARFADFPHGFYPRHPCGWRRRVLDDFMDALKVSIHATRVGGDATPTCAISPTRCFYPRHPCGWRPIFCGQPGFGVQFLSTPPVWVATSGPRNVKADFLFLSTPPVWVATFCADALEITFSGFYPRHPCGWRPISQAS